VGLGTRDSVRGAPGRRDVDVGHDHVIAPPTQLGRDCRADSRSLSEMVARGKLIVDSLLKNERYSRCSH
jgi:hypothetical protein